MDLAGAQQIDLRFNAIAGKSHKVIVNFENVNFLASMGIRTLIMAAKTIQLKGGKMVILKPNADVESVLVGSGTDTFIPIYQDLGTAISSVNI